ncbi:nucleotide exchange factor SIL1 [Entomortierella parvispora]|uniref:Nucleotide exchange factor SIL1 n=1 Tax=Entomortierella parvispora TaxID=205924 RepID=A0A9P3HIG5_9FUNG|nr:nucleotide exchange factor SIL1 [Entomortierella parvispora]
MVRFTSKLTLVLGLCAAVALAKVADQAAVDERSPVICNKGHCYPRVFRPTTEFQEVLDGQEIPGGLHVQMDFETHRKYAKLMDPESVADQERDATNSILVVDTKTPGTFQHSVVGGDDDGSGDLPAPIDIDLVDVDESKAFAHLEEASRMNLQTAFESIPELQDLNNESKAVPSDPAPAPIARKSDHQIFLEQLDLVRTSPDTKVIVAALEELSDIASDMDFGLRLAEGEGLRTLSGLLSCTSESESCQERRMVRARSALVIGTAVQNHEKAQEAAFHANLHKTLLTHLEIETDEYVLRRLIFAYASLVRGSKHDFIQDEDVARLAAVYNQSQDPTFRRKCVYLMSDFADPDMKFIANDTSSSEEQGSEKIVEDSFLGLEVVEKQGVDVGPWCETLQQQNKTSSEEDDGEDWEIIDRAVELLHSSYPETCVLSGGRRRDEL